MVRRVRDEDIEPILSWIEKRKNIKPEPWAFSNTGFIAPGIACGFLYTTNSGFGMLDFFISNPDAKKRDIHKSINLITISLIDLAKKKQIKFLGFSTQYRSIEKMGKKFGFTNNGMQNTFSRSL